MTQEQTFGQKLRQERLRLGLTQVQLAEMGQVKRTTQHLYENDVRVPDLTYLMLLQGAGVDVSYLLFGANQETCPAGVIGLTPLTLSNIYRVVDRFGIDKYGSPLPLDERLRLFQFLCSTNLGTFDDIDVERLSGKLALFANA